jgi:hypothetical protein
MFPRIHPALRQHLDWHERMRKLLANPVLDTLAAQWRREKEHMARAVDSLKLNMKDSTR